MTQERDHDEFARAFEAAFASLQIEVEAACRHGGGWPERIAAGLRATFEFAATEPDAARTLTSDALAQGPPGFERYQRMVEYLSRYLARGRAISFEADLLPESTEKALVGGVSMLIARRLSSGAAGELAAVRGEATELLLTPYLGSEAARRFARGAEEGRR